MAFDKLESVSGLQRAIWRPVSVSLFARGNVPPRFRITLSKLFVAKFAISEADSFDLLLGTGDQKGVIRLKRSKSGVLQPRLLKLGAATFNCGHIERFGTEPEKKQFCRSLIVDADTIEIRLPPWGMEQDV